MYLMTNGGSRFFEDVDIEDVRILAEMIAAKETDRALDLINRLFPDVISVSFVKKNAEWRSGQELF